MEFQYGGGTYHYFVNYWLISPEIKETMSIQTLDKRDVLNIHYCNPTTEKKKKYLFFPSFVICWERREEATTGREPPTLWQY